MNIGEVACKALEAGASDEEALAEVLKAFPDAATKIASIKWYRSKLRRLAAEGKRKPGKEGASQRRTGGLVRDKTMTPEAKEACAEAKRIAKSTEHREQNEHRLELEKARGPKSDRANQFRAAAMRFKKANGCWPSPQELQEKGLV